MTNEVAILYECEECLGSGWVELHYKDVPCIYCDGSGSIVTTVVINDALINAVLEILKR